MRFFWQGARIVAGLTVGAVVGGPACQKPVIEVVLLDAAGARDKATWAEFAAWRGRCPADDGDDDDHDELEAVLGRTRDAPFHSVVPAKDDRMPAPGDLDRGEYAFAALLRASDCSVIAWGCTNSDLAVHRKVTINVSASRKPPIGACVAGEPCACPSAGGLPDAGPGCPLALLAQGKLPAPITPGAALAGPGLVATAGGFVVAYREQAAGGKAPSRATIVTIREDGTLGPPAFVPLDYYDAICAGVIPDDGVGAAWDEVEKGLAAYSLPDCAGQGKAGATFLGFDGAGKVPAGGSLDAVGAGPELALARLHSAAATGAGAFALAYTTGDVGFIMEVAGLQPGKKQEPFPGAKIGFVSIAAGGGLVAALLSTTGEGGTQTQAWSLEPPNTSAKAVLPPATAGGVASWPKGAIGVVAAQGALSWTAVSPAGASLGGGGLQGTGYFAADVAILGSRAIVAGAASHAIRVFRLDGAGAGSIGKTPQATFDSGSASSIDALLASFDGTHLAVAAAREKVAIAWLGRHVLEAADPAGGWALLSCKE